MAPRPGAPGGVRDRRRPAAADAAAREGGGGGGVLPSFHQRWRWRGESVVVCCEGRAGDGWRCVASGNLHRGRNNTRGSCRPRFHSLWGQARRDPRGTLLSLCRSFMVLLWIECIPSSNSSNEFLCGEHGIAPEFVLEKKGLWLLPPLVISIPWTFSSRLGDFRGLCNPNPNSSNEFLCGEHGMTLLRNLHLKTSPLILASSCHSISKVFSSRVY